MSEDLVEEALLAAQLEQNLRERVSEYSGESTMSEDLIGDACRTWRTAGALAHGTPSRSTAIERAEAAEQKLCEYVEGLRQKIERLKPLTLPSEEARQVFLKTLENNPDADMRAVPNEWLLRERSIAGRAVADVDSDPVGL